MNYVGIIVYGVYSDLRTEVSRRLLGFLWWGLEPVLYMATFYIVFGLALRQGGPDYVPFLLSGMVFWKWFDGSVRLASTAIVANHGLAQQIHLPKIIFVIIPLLTNTFKFFIVFLLLVIFLFLTSSPAISHWWALIPVLLTQFFMMFSLAVFLAALLPFLQDLRQIIDNFMMLLMFMSGVFYRVSEVSGEMSAIFRFNPAYQVIHAFREVLLDNRLPDWSALGWCLAVSLPVALTGVALIFRFDRHYPKILV